MSRSPLRLFLGVPREGYKTGVYCSYCGGYSGKKSGTIGAVMFFHCGHEDCEDNWDICLPCYFFSGFSHPHELRLYSGEPIDYYPHLYHKNRKVFCKDCKIECSTLGFFHKYQTENEDYCEDCFKAFVLTGGVKLNVFRRFKCKKLPEKKSLRKFLKDDEDDVSVEKGDMCVILSEDNDSNYYSVLNLRTKEKGFVPFDAFQPSLNEMMSRIQYTKIMGCEISIQEGDMCDIMDEDKIFPLVYVKDTGIRGRVPWNCFKTCPIVKIKSKYTSSTNGKENSDFTVYKGEECELVGENKFQKEWGYVRVVGRKSSQRYGWVPVGNYELKKK